jgi:SP family xylose:H+ symportor-like MFS transporter
MNQVLRWSLLVALSGFLFGFDTVVISGANEPIKELWGTSGWFHGTFIMSMALWGTVIGALFGGRPSDAWGRKRTLWWIGLLFFISAVGSALAWGPYAFSFFRFIGGLAVGASSVTAPTYISEISNAKNRGRFVALYQFMLVFGILVAYISNYLLDGIGGDLDWRWMMGVEAIPALAFTIWLRQVPESPRWLALFKQDTNEAKAILCEIADTKDEADDLLIDILKTEKQSGKGSVLFSKKYKKPLMLAFLLAMFNQLSGINFILYYAPEILENAGFGGSESLLSTVAIGVANLLFTIVGMSLIDLAGRKQLMIIGSIGYILSLALVSYGFYTGASPLFNLTFILTFIASHAIGQGAVIWVFIAEIFPNNVRANGQAWGSGTHWVFAALITLFGAVVNDAFPSGWGIFAFFSGFMVIQLLFVIFLMPETKGRSLEDIEKEMVGED